MDRITPTGWGEQRGQPVRQLGSARAVIEAMGEGGGLFITSSLAKMKEAEAIVLELKLPRHNFIFTPAYAGPEALYRVSPKLTVGVDVDAFAGVMREMWADMQRVLVKRFPKVIWG